MSRTSEQPEELVPGKPLFYATAMPLGGVATGLLVESHEGRPTKIEGNPLHPGSLGASDVFAQAAVLGLYDPDRSQTLTNLGEIRPWSAFLGAIRAALTAQQPLKGAGLRILTESVSSPTLAAQIRDLLTRYPSAKWHQWDPASRENARGGAKLAFGDYADVQYRFDRADVILALDADFLASGPGSLTIRARLRRTAAPGRRRADEPVVRDREHADVDRRSRGSPAAAEAERHRKGGSPDRSRALAWSMLVPATDSGRAVKWVTAVAKDLQAHRGASLVLAGDSQPPIVHALAHAMNEALGNVGQTVVYTNSVEAEPIDQLASLQNLVADMDAGAVDLLVIVSGNPSTQRRPISGSRTR